MLYAAIGDGYGGGLYPYLTGGCKIRWRPFRDQPWRFRRG